MATATPTTLMDQLASDPRFPICERRLARAHDQFPPERLVISAEPGRVHALVGCYAVTVTAEPALEVSCECPDWERRGVHVNQPCKHVLAVALATPPLRRHATAQSPLLPPAPGQTVFGRAVAAEIARAAAALTEQVASLVAAGEVPLLLGPTGCAKTSAVRALATAREWGFEEVTGVPSFADADLVGVRGAGGLEIPGVLARAFRRAREGETVLVFLDEFTRFNRRAQDLLMRPLTATPAAVAPRMGIPTDAPVRLVEAPLWGVKHAPVARTPLVLAANPWGAPLDAAFARRVTPVFVGFADAVAALFDEPLAGAIRQTWEGAASGVLPLPLEYGALARARSADDRALLPAYLARLRAVDRAAEEGLRMLLEGQGVLS